MTSYTLYEPFYFQFERLLNDASPSKQGVASGRAVVRSFKPRLDLHEDTEKNVITAFFDFPGFSKDEVQLDFQNGKLTVSAEAKKPENHPEGYTLRERLHGKFSRTLQLPQGLRDEQINARMDNGVLTVTFPRTLPELGPKKIAISEL